MKITAAVRVVIVAAALADQSAHAAEAGQTVVVYLANEHVAVDTQLFAKDQASKVLARIGVRIEWRPVGHAPLQVNALVVEMVEQGSRNECVGALACAKPYEGIHIRVFYDRFQATPENLKRTLLAYVLVHEITHILQGVSRHSESGIMKVRWDADDYVRMTRKGLPFTEQDVFLIKRGLANRDSGLAVAGSTSASAGGTL